MTDDRSGEASQQKPPEMPSRNMGLRDIPALFIGRYRDFALLLTGSLIGLLGTCSTLMVQTTTFNRQLQAGERERTQQEATAVFNDYGRHTNELTYRQDRLWAAARGLPGAGSYDSALARLELAVEAWRLEEPRTRALVRTYFGARFDHMITIQDSLMTGFLDLVYKLKAAHAQRKVVVLSPAQFNALPAEQRERIRAHEDSALTLDRRIAEQIAHQRQQDLEIQTLLAQAIREGLPRE